MYHIDYTGINNFTFGINFKLHKDRTFNAFFDSFGRILDVLLNIFFQCCFTSGEYRHWLGRFSKEFSPFRFSPFWYRRINLLRSNHIPCHIGVMDINNLSG